ncbi:hypothetical protein [Aneurinibacillus aneurinilyticus]|uniref:Uncharacterized protein n=1 Tax=Aneurinibacillus aneurinilyticus ATCC 12856 TaxID=649747 RepID=U1YF53_ANEAE|nr:hypothetical protein [Aneurinibacillus aneurinilyticus]ERI10717.1 hypothetical protein HMPREF0083_01184 [Aneurinibacillus aneurinilyticus ATCC 12856]MED0709619.1 hypothetical protein [Aneurinibacillus aneurinilyticus]MED0726604.1 hypothetical protein [Aneurinibacillus aneurinilyticus]MED0735387.1 hypothetical protein [Aneurinibacillus aneurinilyticus]MED0744303.1 hypothetical protein [Aneurinibacillus aneurinilyticus]
MFKKFFGLLLGFVLTVGLMLTGGVSYAQENENPLESPASYAKYLENYDKYEALRLGVDPKYADEAEQDAKKVLIQFKKLSIEEQEKLVEAMQNPAMIENSFANAEVKEESPQNASLLANDKFVEHDFTMTLVGIDWTIYHVEGRYEYNSSGATKALGGQAFVKRNFNPFVQTNKQSQDFYVSGGKFKGIGVFDYKIGPIKDVINIQIGTAYVQVMGDQNGKIDLSSKGWTE